MVLRDALERQKDVFVIDRSIAYSDYASLDLSVHNPEINVDLVSNLGAFSRYIDEFLSKTNAKAAFGGYNERRGLYKRSPLFGSEDTDQGERDIHIGLDIWAPADTPVLAALDATVHSFDYNAGRGNYGPTIILEHQIDNVKFFTLYGHLSIESIEDIEIGDIFKKGKQIATLGDVNVNGGYPAHLHFQIIADIEDYFGDYPGVCSQNDIDFYLENCPDPNLLLKIKHTT